MSRARCAQLWDGRDVTRAWWIVVAVALLGRGVEAQSLFDRPGVYTYAPDTGQEPAIVAAVNRGVHGMLPTPHRIARHRLLESTKLPAVLRLLVAPDSIGTQTDSGKAMTLPRSGVTIRWDDGHGDVCRAHETVVADTLTQFCDAGSGGSAYQYVPASDGHALTMIVHITSPHLPGAVDYTVEFHGP